MMNLQRNSLSVLFLAAALVLAGGWPAAYGSQTILNESSASNVWTLPTGTNLLVGSSISPATANVHEGSSANWGTLLDGSVGNSNGADLGNSVTPNNGDSVTFTLNTSVNVNGYTITSLDTYCAWQDSGRDNQDYTVSYSTVSAPTTFITIATAANHTGAPLLSTHVRITNTTGTVATNVAAIQFSFAAQENGYTGFREFIVLGAAVPLNPPVTWSGLSGTGGTATWSTTPDSNWVKTSDGTAANYAQGAPVTFDSTGTNTTITVQGAGVTPDSLVFTNGAGTPYSFGGGAISTVTASGILSVSGAGSVTMNSVLNLAAAISLSNGALSLNAANTIAGPVTVSSGALSLGNNLALGNSALIVNGGTVNFLTAAPVITSLTGSASSIVLGNATGPVNSVLSLGSSNTSTTYSGAISQAAGATGGLTKTGTGVLSLGGVNTYSGNTSVNGGTLQLLTGSSLGAGSAVSVGAGNNLTGSGAANGTVTVVATAHLAPGINTGGNFGGIGTLTLGAANLNANSVLDLDVGAANSSDLIAVTGVLTLPVSGSVTVNLPTNGTLVTNGTYKLLTFGSLANTFSAGSLKLGTPAVGGGTFTFVQNGNEIDLVITGVSTAGGVFSSLYLGAGNFDTSVGLNAAKTYLNAVNTGTNAATPAIVVNGVSFERSFIGLPNGVGTLGSTWLITGANAVTNAGANNVTGNLGLILNDFVYGGSPDTLALQGLVPGQCYIVTFYNRAFDPAGQRVQTLSATDGGKGVFDEDVGSAVQGDGSLLKYTFVANGSNESVSLLPQTAGNTMHIYGFSTELVFIKSYVSGSAASTAVFNPAGAPNGQGSNVAFPAQAAPTVFNLDVPVTLGHVSVDGANAWTFTGNAATLQADPGGVSALDIVSGTHTISAPVVLLTDAAKLGGGNLILSGGVSGTGGLITNAGVLSLQSTNSYTGATVVNGGLLQLNNAGALGSGATKTSSVTVAANAILDLNGFSPAGAPSNFSGAGNGAGVLTNSSSTAAVYAGDVTSASGAFTVGGTGNITMTGAIIGAATVTLTKTGSNTLTLSGVTDNTNLILVVNGGSVVLSKSSSASVHAASSVVVNAGSVVKLGGSGGDQISDTAAVTLNANGTLDFNGQSEAFDALNGNGIITNNSAATTSTVTVGAGGGNGGFTGTIQNGASNAGIVALTKAGLGSLLLGGTATYTGPTIISAGTIKLSAPASTNLGIIPNFSFETPPLGGGFQYNPTGSSWTFTTANSGISANGSAFNSANAPDGTQAGLMQRTGAISQALTFPGAGIYTLTFGTEFRGGQGGPNTFNVTLDGTSLPGLGAVIPASSSSFNTLSSTFPLTAGGTHTLAFTGTPPDGNDRTSFIDNILISGPAAGGLSAALPAASALSIASGATLDLNSYSATVGSLADVVAGAGGSIVNTNLTTPATLTVNLTAGSSTCTSVISDSGAANAISIVKSGAGTLFLTGANTYSGATTVSAGTLRGTGSANSAFTVTANVFPGVAPKVINLIANETMNAASANLSGGKLQIVTRHSGGGPFTQNLNLTGALTISSASVLSLAYEGVANSDALTVLQTSATTGLPTTAFSSVLPVARYHVDFDVVYKNGGPAGTTVATSPALGATIGAWDTVVIKFLNNPAVTPVKVEAFAARAEGAGVVLEWTAVSEFQNAGFNLYRRPFGANAWTLANSALIAGRVTNPDVKKYRLYDWAPSGAYEYKLESVSIQGVRETYAKLAGPVTVDRRDAAATAEGLDAALASVALAAELKRGEALSAKFAGEPRSEGSGASNAAQNGGLEAAAPGATLAYDAQGKLSLPAASVRALNQNDGSAAVGAAAFQPPLNSASIAVPAAGASSAAAASARWFSSTVSRTGSYTGAKVVYSVPGVLLIPQAMLPIGFNANHLSITREGRTLTALAVTADGLVVFGKGYQDDYTDKDAMFLRNTSGATPAGQILHASGLFTGATAVNTDSPATVTSDYHDVYFDFNLRPYTFAPWFSSQYLTDGTDQSFSVSTPNASSGAASLTVNLWSLTATSGVSPDHALQVLINGQPAGQATWTGGNTMMQITFQLASGVLNNNGANQIDLVTPELSGVSSQISFLHSMTIGYTKSLNGSTSLDVYNKSAQSKLFEVSNVPSGNAWVVDARYPDRAALVAYESQAQAGGTYRLRFNGAAGGTGHYLVVPAGMENLPISVSKRQIKPVKAMTYMPVGPAQFSSAVQPLLMQRSKEGLRGTFVDQEHIFDYYNYGRYGPTGIQNAVRSVRPQYLLLLGRTTYDYRDYSGLGVDPLCPTFLVSTTFWAQATSDSMFGDLGRGYPEVAVGRLPVNNAGELNNAVKHVLSNTGLSTGYRVHASADRADSDAGDFAAEADGIAQAHPGMAWQPDYLGVTYQTSPEVTAALTAAANGGADLLMYIGHGNAVRLGNEVPRILDNDSVSAWTGSAVFLQSTCTANWMAKNEAGYQSIAIQALTQPQGGISASIASSTYMNSQNATEFMSQLLTNAGTTQRWGNALLKTQQWAFALGSGFYSDLSKTEQIFGDPAMPVMSKAAATAGNTPGTGLAPGQF